MRPPITPIPWPGRKALTGLPSVLPTSPSLARILIRIYASQATATPRTNIMICQSTLAFLQPISHLRFRLDSFRGQPQPLGPSSLHVLNLINLPLVWITQFANDAVG